MPDRRQAPTEYRAAQLAARAKAGELGASSLRDVQEAVKRYADELAQRIKALDPSTQWELFNSMKASHAVVLQASAKLENKLAQIVKQHRTAGFNEVQEIWREAGLKAAHAVGIPNSMLGAVLSPNVTLAGAYEGLGGAGRTWRTLITGHTANAAKEADALIRQALVTGMSPDELAMGLRKYATALSPKIKVAFPGATADQLAALEATARSTKTGLKTLRRNTSRIAFSETHNARAEAEIQHFAADPLVDAVIWRLSPNRGTLGAPDACDVLASIDMYGLGPGVYPIHNVPLPPHPHDRCERVPRTRYWAEAGEPKPNPVRIWTPKTGDMHLKQICSVD